MDDDHSIRGWMKCTPEGGGWGDGDGKADYTVYFCLRCSKPLQQDSEPGARILRKQLGARRREDIESDRYRERVAAAQQHARAASGIPLRIGAGREGLTGEKAGVERRGSGG